MRKLLIVFVCLLMMMGACGEDERIEEWGTSSIF
jgi:hypothetical protein